MSAYWLKTLALVAMFCDHLGAVCFPEVLWLRIVGRLTMPIMCFFIGVGYRHTRDVKKYMGRLFVFAILSEVPFDLAIHGRLFYPYSQNVFLTLFLGLLAIYLFERYRHGIGGPLVLVCGAGASLLMADYGFWGVLLVVGLYLYGDDSRGMLFVLGILNIFFYFGTIQMAGVLAFIPLSLYSGERGPSLKYAFYLFYPLHLLFLAFLAGRLALPPF